MQPNASPTIAVQSSGSSRSAIAVEPAMSANSTVSGRRSLDAAGVHTSGPLMFQGHRKRKPPHGYFRYLLSAISPVLFVGCKPEVAAFDGRIIAVGAGARAAAGRGAEVVRLRGTAWPGMIDSHIHLEGLAERKLTVD